MASSDKDASCANDPDFAVICAFLEKFSEQLQVHYPDFKQLEDWISNTDEVPNGLRDLHIKLMRKTRRTVHECAWESALSKFCFCYSSQDGWEIERFGYKKSSLKVKLRILRELLESQFDRNNKFRAKLLTMSADSLRSQPIGRDRLGHAYWLTQDMDCNLRIYQEHLDEEIWQVVATNRDELVKLISRLRGNEVVLPSEIGVVDEDSSSNSCSVPIIKPPPPEEKDDSQESNHSSEGRIPNIKIKLDNKENGKVMKNEAVPPDPEDKTTEKEEEKKVKPLVISHSKITMEKLKKRPLEEHEKPELETIKKQRPSLLDSNREKKLSKYEKAKQDDDEDDDEDDSDDVDDEDGEEEEEEGEDEDDEAEVGEEDEEEDEDGEEEEEEDDAEHEQTPSKITEEAAKENKDIKDVEPVEENKEASPIVGGAIEDPPVFVKEEGSGTECETSYYKFLLTDEFEHELEFSEVIEEATVHVVGEGTGQECLVGNDKSSEAEPKATFFFGQPGCLKLNPVKNQPKNEQNERTNDNDKEGANPEEETKKVPEPANGESHSDEVEQNPAIVVEKKEEKQSNNDGGEEAKKTLRQSVISRKRRLSDEKPGKLVRHSSESETDPNSEILEDEVPEVEEEEEDIGGKRPKMRNKNLMTTEVRKKVEAQRKIAAVDEATSSSGEEEWPSKKIPIKKVDKEINKILPLKAKLKQAAAIALKEKEEQEAAAAVAKEEHDFSKEVPPKVEKQHDLAELEERPVRDSISPPKPAEVSEEETSRKRSVEPESPPSSLLSKQTKKPNTHEPPEEVDSEIPKKKQAPEQDSTQSPTENDKTLKSIEKENNSEGEIKKTPEKCVELPAEEHTTSENQRKRRSSEDGSRLNEACPKSSTAPTAVVKTRSGRRGGPPELVGELPQLKRTRVKAAEKPKLDKDVPQAIAEVAKTKVKTGPRTTANKSAVKKEVMEEQKMEVVKEEKTATETSVKEEPQVEADTKPSKATPKPITLSRPQQQAAQKQPASAQRRKNHDDVDTKNIIDLESDSTPVRQSRRIAQLKIREEADRRKMEEIALRNMKAELKKKKKAEMAEDPTVSEPSEHSSDHADSEVEVKKKAEKKKKCPGKGGWSSGSEEPEEEEEEQYESDPGSPLFRSDHEFSPESEMEDESQVVPLKRARTARKEGEEVVAAVEVDESCQKCGKSDHPEWILLCDKCDRGYHCSCLSPVIFYIPEGDWFCPPCQQEELIVALENNLKEFDDLVQRKKEQEEEKVRTEELDRLEQERVAQVKDEKKNKRKQGRKKKVRSDKNRAYRKALQSDDDDDDDESGEDGTETDATNSSRSTYSNSRSSKSKSDSASDSDDEPIYKLRKRRQINVSYRLNEYDDMIKSALKEEEDEVAGAGNLGRGKDISTIIEADKEEKLRQQQRTAGENGEETEGVEKPQEGNAPELDDSGSDFEPLKRKPKAGRHIKKKPRKLTTLDISSEGDNDSDEDFKTSSMDDEEDDDEEEDEGTQSSDSSLEMYRRRRGGKKKKTRRAARRAARERRKDRKFIVDDSDGSDDVERKQSKKKRKKDSDYTESETNDDDDDEELSENIDSDDLCDDSTENEASDGAWRPSAQKKKQHSNAIARKSPKLKPKAASKAKKTKRVDDNNRSFKACISKNRMVRDDSEDDSDDSVDSSRKTRGKRCTYLEDYEDDSSDGGIKPGVKRPDTPPEEREQFIKKQEEIKRMLAEKNAEGAKLAATPRLVPIKAGAQRSPAKIDSLSTVPLSVIRQAKVLDIDYLQRKGESISEGDLDESEFDDDDLPDDFNPEDMDEEAIARMVEEEDFAQQQQLKLPPPNEVLRRKPAKEAEAVYKPLSSAMTPQQSLQSSSSSASGLQEPVRKKLPMPTMHPPLLRHGYGPPLQHMLQHNRSQQPHLPLLQNALSAPLNHPRSFPPTTQAIPATTQGMGSSQPPGGDPNKPRGRRKKITPLRDPLQKQQAAAAASAAAAAASKPRADDQPQGKADAGKPPVSGAVATPSVIKSALSIAQPPQLYKPPPANTQPSVITRMPHLQGRPPMMPPVGGPPFGPRFYGPPPPQSQQPHQQQSPGQPPPNALLSPGGRSPMRHRGPPMSQMPSHHTLRPSYVAGPPPLRPSSGPPISLANDSREQGPPPRPQYSGPNQQFGPPPARHSAPPHLSPYRPQMFGNPGFPQRGPPPNPSQSGGIRPPGAPPEYSSPGSYVGGYGYYPPPPLSVPHSAPPPPTASAVPSSVIVSASSLAAATCASAVPSTAQPIAAVSSRPPASSPSLIEKSCAPIASKSAAQSVIELSRKKLTTLETFNTSKTATPPPLIESSESRSPYSSNPPTAGGIDEIPDDGNSGSPPASSQSTSEFSGLVSYFSSQHDDLNT